MIPPSDEETKLIVMLLLMHFYRNIPNLATDRFDAYVQYLSLGADKILNEAFKGGACSPDKA